LVYHAIQSAQQSNLPTVPVKTAPAPESLYLFVTAIRNGAFNMPDLGGFQPKRRGQTVAVTPIGVWEKPNKYATDEDNDPRGVGGGGYESGTPSGMTDTAGTSRMASQNLCRRIVYFIVLFAALHTPAFADPISINIQSALIATDAGTTVTFLGTVSNNIGTGETLDAFSYFFDFNNFDTSALSTPVQILPVFGIDFDIPDQATSALTQLFSMDLLNVAAPGNTYPFDVTVQAINAAGDTLTGNTLSVAITAASGSPQPPPPPPPSPVPEPATLPMLAAGLSISLIILFQRGPHRIISKTNCSLTRQS
jgi:hypothetical protein